MKKKAAAIMTVTHLFLYKPLSHKPHNDYVLGQYVVVVVFLAFRIYSTTWASTLDKQSGLMHFQLPLKVDKLNTCLHLYLTSSTCDRIDENAS